MRYVMSTHNEFTTDGLANKQHNCMSTTLYDNVQCVFHCVHIRRNQFKLNPIDFEDTLIHRSTKIKNWPSHMNESPHRSIKKEEVINRQIDIDCICGTIHPFVSKTKKCLQTSRTIRWWWIIRLNNLQKESKAKQTSQLQLFRTEVPFKCLPQWDSTLLFSLSISNALFSISTLAKLVFCDFNCSWIQRTSHFEWIAFGFQRILYSRRFSWNK